MSGGRFIAIVLQGERMGRKLFLTLFHLGIILFGLPLWTADPSATTAPSGGEAKGQSLDDLNKELSNSVTSGRLKRWISYVMSLTGSLVNLKNSGGY